MGEAGWYWHVMESRFYLRFLVYLIDLELVGVHNQCVLSTSFCVFGGALSQGQGGGFIECMNISLGIWVLKFRSDGFSVSGSILIELI